MNRTSRLIIALFLIVSVSWDFPVNDDWKKKVDDQLLQRSAQQTKLDFLVLLNAQANVADAQAIRGKAAKGTFVFNELRALAQESQAEVVALLESRSATFRPFFIVNAISVKGDIALIQELASLEAVAQIQDNPKIKIQEPTNKANPGIDNRSVIEWGVQQINAPAVWDMGYQGQGVIVGGQDTGYEWEHPAIKDRYNGWNGTTADHNYNWHDAIHEINPLHGDPTNDPSNNPCGLDSNVPCDDHNHGTHTMGTMIGDDGMGNQVGVAPQATWIACRNMERGYGSPSSYIECFEWFLAPTDLNDANPDPTRAPHVINNSWSCPEMEGCNAGNWSLMETAVNNLKAAGVVVVVSAGNSGSECGTVQTPAAMFENSFTIGASNIEDGIAGFSSRGPVMVDGSGRLKPNVVAPGVGVRSAVRGGGYQTWNGTSMAGPHVAGAVALLISANPELAGEVEAIESLFEQTSVQLLTDQVCGGISGMAVPNNTFGYGRIDAFAAVEAALGTTTSTEDLNLSSRVVALPNPFSDAFNLHFQNMEGEVQVVVFDGIGKQINQFQWTVEHGSTQRINMANMPGGVYFYKVFNEDQELAEGKLLKQ